MAEPGAGGGPREPPRSLQGLLQLAVTASEPRAEPAAEPREPLSEERREWLRAAVTEALSGAGGDVEQLRRCLRVLAEEEEEEEAEAEGEAEAEAWVEEAEEEEAEAEEEAGAKAKAGGSSRCLQALELLAELCESLDNATAFCELGGLEAVAGRLGGRGGAGAAAGRLLGVCAQNLPGAQRRALALGCLPALLRRLRRDPPARPAALFALSCLVRGQPEALAELERLGGLPTLLAAARSPRPPLRARAAFLLHSLLQEHPRLSEPLCSLGAVGQLGALLRSPHDASHEHLMGALCSLAAGCPTGAGACRAPELGLEPLLRERRCLLQGREEFREELEFCEQLLRLCFEPPPEGSASPAER